MWAVDRAAGSEAQRHPPIASHGVVQEMTVGAVAELLNSAGAEVGVIGKEWHGTGALGYSAFGRAYLCLNQHRLVPSLSSDRETRVFSLHRARAFVLFILTGLGEIPHEALRAASCDRRGGICAFTQSLDQVVMLWIWCETALASLACLRC